MWIYRQQTGELYHNALKVASGYSGYGVAKNDPTAQDKPGLGPIPQGAYLIGAEATDDKHGPVALHLIPLNGTETFGRFGFMVHGDGIEHPGSVSHGCIIINRPVRENMADGHDKLLLVIPELPRSA